VWKLLEVVFQRTSLTPTYVKTADLKAVPCSWTCQSFVCAGGTVCRLKQKRIAAGRS
jgi:hypothetical protein